MNYPLVTPMDPHSAMLWNDELSDVVFNTPTQDGLLLTLVSATPFPWEDHIDRSTVNDEAIAIPTFWLPEWLARPREGEGVDRYILRVCKSLNAESWYDEATGQWDSALDVFGCSAQEALERNLRLDIPGEELTEDELYESLDLLLELTQEYPTISGLLRIEFKP